MDPTHTALISTATTAIGALAGWLVRGYRYACEHRAQEASALRFAAQWFNKLADLLNSSPANPLTLTKANDLIKDVPPAARPDAAKVVGALAAANPVTADALPLKDGVQ